MPPNPLPYFATRPERLAGLTLREWDHLVPLARHSRLLARLQAILERQALLDRVPEPARLHLEAAALIAKEHERRIRWETEMIRQALAGTGIPVVLLKGAAYLLAGLPNAPGRLAADVDLLVAEEHLDTIEQRLRKHGWGDIAFDDYDQRYYRRWMHELPPLRHRLRGTELDLHHAIVPRTSRLKPDPQRLLAATQPLGTDGHFRILAPTDMVLHCATHAFYDGDLQRGLRDMVDIHELLMHFGSTQGEFWDRLPQRARELNMERPLYYALRYTCRIMETPVPARVLKALGSAGPPALMRPVMDSLVRRTLLSPPLPDPTTRLAQWLLYVRSHWLRMPPSLLLPHLGRKAWRRLRGQEPLPKQVGN
ncbi:MAG: nucleotidyltransferase family protein [Candidatus Competibacteraceae bacterium]|nr:nucleotidyltransferase family protein [Candidatus Competibacteraceae bacterium]